MPEMRTQRRLAAILVTDVVGYSRLMEDDETGTLAVLKDRHQRIFKPIIEDHNGRIVKALGDGLLVEFASAVNAVEAALELQTRCNQENRNIADDQSMRFRIGINLGDVVGEGSDILGDGVNVAARIEALAEPGSICISDSVFQQVRRKVSVEFSDLGPIKLKNISEPVRVFATQASGEEFRRQHAASGAKERPIILVLPFVAQGEDSDQAYFSNGFTRDIITDLSRFSRLSLIWQDVAFNQRNKAGDSVAIARSLGASFLVKGGIYKLSDRIRLSVDLIGVEEGRQIWSDRRDFLGEELFTVRDDVVHSIVSTLVGRVSAARLQDVRRKAPSNLAAYDCVLLGDALPLAEQNYREAQSYYERAMALDPDYPRAHIRLSYLLSLRWLSDFGAGDSDLLDLAFEHARKAVFLDANDPDNLNALGWIYLVRRAFPQATHYFRKAYEFNPQDAPHNGYMGVLSSFLGDSDAALNWLSKAQQLDPYFEPAWFCHTAGLAHFTAGRYSDTIEQMERSITMPFYVIAYLAAATALDGRQEEARQWAQELMKAKPDFSREKFVSKEMLMREGDRSTLLRGLEKAALP